MKFEFSAGGIVIEGNKVLAIRTKNLSKMEVWAFPKGHIEKNEKAVEAALREVQEETGYKCSVVGEIDKVEYFFKNGNDLIKKTVKWFLMTPIEKTGEPDKEIDETKWVNLEEIRDLLSYDSDKKLINKLSMTAIL